MKFFDKETSEIVKPFRELSAEEMIAISGAKTGDATLHGNGRECTIKSETFVNGVKIVAVVCK